MPVADNDEMGAKRAAQSAEAARNVGLSCLVLNAQDIWDNMPKGGSIDDAPGTGAERVATLLSMVEQFKASSPQGVQELEDDDDRSEYLVSHTKRRTKPSPMSGQNGFSRP